VPPDCWRIASSFRLKGVPTTGERFERAVAIMAKLRAPGGCPWDREQTFDSIKPYTIEETYEVVEAIDNRDFPELAGELGDLLLQILFYSQMAGEENHFSIDDVLDGLAEKLVRRHPHVFGEVKAESSGEVIRNWEAIKAAERGRVRNPPRDASANSAPELSARRDGNSVLEGASRAHPGLLEAFKLSSLAANAGFDWPNLAGIFEKLDEEIQELKVEVEKIPPPGPKPVGRGTAGAGAHRPAEKLRPKLEEEVGDLLFALVNLARYLSLDPESALKRTNRKFRARFAFIEQAIRGQGRKLEDASLEEMENLWQQAKTQVGAGR